MTNLRNETKISVLQPPLRFATAAAAAHVYYSVAAQTWRLSSNFRLGNAKTMSSVFDGEK